MFSFFSTYIPTLASKMHTRNYFLCVDDVGQVEPSLAVLRGSAFLAINDEYVEFSDIISLKVPA